MTTNAKGSVYPRGPTWFWCQYKDGQRQKPVRLGSRAQFRSKHAAEAERDRRLMLLNPLAIDSGKQISMTELITLYASNQVPTMKPASQASVRSILDKHISRLGPFPLTAVNALVIQAFVNELHANELSRKTIDNVLVVIKRMQAFARRNGFPTPAYDKELIRLPPSPITTEQRFYTSDEMQMMIDASPWPWKACWALLGGLGIRCGEVLGLTWKHIHLDAQFVSIQQSAVNGRIQTVKSKNSQGDMPIANWLCEIVRAYREWIDTDGGEHPQANGLLFHNEHGQPFTGDQARYQLSAVQTQLGIQHGGLHAFRHGVATRLFATGSSATTVKGLLRHGRLETTLRYTHVIDSDKRDAFNRAGLFQDRTKPLPSDADSSGNV